MMLDATALATMGAAIFGASVLSGIFGMAGGLILLGVLLLYVDVVPGMVLFGAIQVTAGSYRAALWMKHVRWDIVWRYLLGATVAFVIMRWVRFVPDKAFIYIALGIMPFAAELLPRSLTPDITRPGVPFFCGILLQSMQLMAGATGVVFDMFFQKAMLDRKMIIGTKSIVQVAGHAMRVGYFASLAATLDFGLPWWAFAGAIVLAIAGTQIAGMILERMSDAGFRSWSWRLIYSVSGLYVLRGLWLMTEGWRG